MITWTVIDQFGLYVVDTSPLFTGYFVLQLVQSFSWNKLFAVVDKSRIQAAFTVAVVLLM